MVSIYLKDTRRVVHDGMRPGGKGCPGTEARKYRSGRASLRVQISPWGLPVGRTRNIGLRRHSPARPHSSYDFQRLHVPEKIPCLGTAISMPWNCDFHALELRFPCLGTAISMPWDCEFHALELEFHALEMSANCSGRSVRPLRSARGRSKAAQPGDMSRERFSDIDGTMGACGVTGSRSGRHPILAVYRDLFSQCVGNQSFLQAARKIVGRFL